VLPGAYYLDPFLLYGTAYDPYAFGYDTPLDYTSGAYAEPYTYAEPYSYGQPAPGPVVVVSFGPSAIDDTGLATAPYSYNYSSGRVTSIGSGRSPITPLPGGALSVTLGPSNSMVVQPCVPVDSRSPSNTGGVVPLAAPLRPAPDSAGHLRPYVFTGPPSPAAPQSLAPVGGPCWGVDGGGLAVIVWG
jgi:hypothetical protein